MAGSGGNVVKKRMLIMLAAVVVFLGAIGSVKYFQIKSAIAAGSSYAPPPEAVTTMVAKQEQWPEVLGAVGSVYAVKGVMVSADLPGLVAKIHFESGSTVQAGSVLAELDTTQERAQLEAAEAQRELARANYERAKGLRAEGVIAASDYDLAAATARSAEARVVETKATIQRKTIRAPFSGRLGIRQINLGQYLAQGAPIVQLQSWSPVYVNFSIPQSRLADVRVGAEVHVEAQGLEGSDPVGKVSAVESIIDEKTRNVQVQATFDNRDDKLRPGMFVECKMYFGGSQPVISLPATAINYAPYGDSLYIVEELKDPKGKAYKGVRQQFVKLGERRGDMVAVLSGLKPGEEVVTSGVFKLRPGAAVEVNNDVKPSSQTEPKPENS
jgi:membrane fusion protein (multidrug efflux system)